MPRRAAPRCAVGFAATAAAHPAMRKIPTGGPGGRTDCIDGAHCIYDAARCVRLYDVQCGMLESEVEEKCGSWPQCDGVVCRADYNGYCLARGRMSTEAAYNMWGYTKHWPDTPPTPTPADLPTPVPPTWPDCEYQKCPCAGDYGQRKGDPCCCGQPGSLGGNDICPEKAPTCVGFIQGKRMGRCVPPTPSPTPVPFPAPPTPAPTADPFTCAWINKTYASTPHLPPCPWPAADAVSSRCVCPDSIKIVSGGDCGGCHDFPGVFCQYEHRHPELLVLGFPGEVSSGFEYQRFTRLATAHLTATLGLRVRFEWIQARWESCRTNRNCKKQTGGSPKSFRTCAKEDALQVMAHARRVYNMSRVVFIGHSAGATAMFELLADAHVPRQWVVERLVFMSPGKFEHSAAPFDQDRRQVLARRAARDATQAVLVYASNDPDSAPAAASIESLWGEIRTLNSSMPASIDEGAEPWPLPFPHGGMQDNFINGDGDGTHGTERDFLNLTFKVMGAFVMCTLDAQCAGGACVNGACARA